MQNHKTDTVIILSEDNGALVLEYVVETSLVDNIIKTRYSDKNYQIVTMEQLPKFFNLFPFCYGISDWSRLTFYIKNYKSAKDMVKESWRAARKPILEKLDTEFMRALETGDTQKQQEIVLKKQALRDITNTSLPDNLEEIRNTWPDILNSI